MTKDEALRFALEALENITSVSICEATHHAKKDRHLLCEECPNEVRHLKAITAIKAALEVPEEKYIYGTPLLDAMTKEKNHASECQVSHNHLWIEDLWKHQEKNT